MANQTTRKKKIRKGDYGYIRNQKKVRFLRVVLCFSLPIAFFIVGLILNHGDRKSIYTIIALVGCIPGCMAIVSLIMVAKLKPMEEKLYQEISSHAGDLLMAYELYLTTYDKNLFLDASAFCGEYMVAYTHENIKHADLAKMEKHVYEIFRTNEYRTNVKIFDSKKAFLERLDTLCERQQDFETAAEENFRPYEKYPDLTRSEVIKHLAMAISL